MTESDRIWALQTALSGVEAQLEELHGHLERIAHAAGVDTDCVTSTMVGAIIDRLEAAGGGE